MNPPRVDAVDLIAAVTEPTRRQLLDLLLERAGLVDGERSGREMHYRVNPDRLDDVTGSLSQVASTWDRRLLRIKRLAEAAHGEGVGADRRSLQAGIRSMLVRSEIVWVLEVTFTAPQQLLTLAC